MQAYDLIMIIVLAIATLLGAIKGLAWQVASLASIVVSYFVAVNFRFDLAKMIHAAPPWNVFLAMLILYVGTSFVIWVAFRLFSGLIDQVRLKEFDRHLGALLGLAKGAILCLLITMFAMTLLGPKQQEAICQSRSGYYIARALDNATGVLPKELHEVVGPYLDRLDQQLNQQFPGSNLPGSNLAGSNQVGSEPGWFGGSGVGGGANPWSQEQGAGSGFNFWPSLPAAPTQNAPTQNAPTQNAPSQPNFPAILPPPGSFGLDPNAIPSLPIPSLPSGYGNGYQQQAQAPMQYAPR